MRTLKTNNWSQRAAIHRWPALFLMVAGMQNLVLLPLPAATPKKEITDHGITIAVKRDLHTEKGIAPGSIDVNTSQGITTLSGAVDNLLAKERAVKVAESIRGVLGVIDRVVVTPVSRPDEDIRKDILTALLQDPATDSYQVAVSVSGSAATLTGRVGSHAEKQLAARLAKGVKGVKEVRNDITINPLAKRTDAEIAADVKARIQWDIWLSGDPIHAAVKNGQVTLTGTVGSALAHARAFDDAWVDGAAWVEDSGLKVDPNACEAARRGFKDGTTSDAEIKQAVLAALHLDPRVTAFSPDVTVEDGVVILGGGVGNLKAKAAAEQDANDIVGVLQVDNLLQVKPKQWPTDAEMQKQLRAALAWDPLLDGAAIDAAVINRVAYLAGGVDSLAQKTEAHDVALRIKGVVLVRNHLKVEPEFTIAYYDWPYYYSYYGQPYYTHYNQPPYLVSDTFGPQPNLSDEQIKKNIENAFFWSPFVHRNDITVSVDGSVATLTGTVGSWIAYGEADKDAHKGGATAVLNRLKVR